MTGLVRVAGVIVAVGLAGACTATEDDFGGEAVARKVDLNTPELNGPILQGPILQGTVLQGIINGPILQGPILQGPILQGPILQGPILQGPILQGVTLNGPILQGPILQGPILQGPILQGSLFTGTVLSGGEEISVSGTDFIGSEWRIEITEYDGEGNSAVENYVLRIDDMSASQDADDVYVYDIVYRPAASAEWKPLCSDAANNPVGAIPLQNYWNLETGDRVDEPNVFTFACTNAVLAKCVLWGYRPWATADRCKHQNKPKDKHCQEVSLRDYHQACTRMARADYCGDGTPWTIEGTPIDVQDDLTPPIESPTTEWTLEAEWTPDGAFCVDDMRQQAWKEAGQYPACFLDKKGKPIIKKDCGTMKKDRAMMISTFDK